MRTGGCPLSVAVDSTLRSAELSSSCKCLGRSSCDAIVSSISTRPRRNGLVYLVLLSIYLMLKEAMLLDAYL